MSTRLAKRHNAGTTKNWSGSFSCLIAGLCLSACGNGTVIEDTVTSSADGHYLLDLSGDDFHRGENSIELCVIEAETGHPALDLRLELLPFMPAMGHGSSAVSSSVATIDGCYAFDGVVLSMPGTWELRTTIQGKISDFASPKLYLD